VAAALLISLGWALTSALASSSTPAPGKVTVRIGWTREPDNLNPFIGWENSSYEIWTLNYSFLFGFGVDEKPTLDLASEFPTTKNGGISADGKVWTIHLRPDVRWQDGRPLTADDVAWTYNYVVQNKMANFTTMTSGIKQAVAVDPTTVRIVCSRPKADMEALWLPILPKHIWQDVNPKAAQANYANKPPIVGTGPFQTVQVKKGVFVRMAANKDYFGGAPHIDEILFTAYQNPESMTADLKSGAIDAAWGMPRALFGSLRTTPGIEGVAYNYFNWDYLDFNCYDQPPSMGNPVLRDPRFRQALNYAIDRTTICKIAFGGNAKPATTIMTPDTWTDPDWHWQPPADQVYTFDIGKAQQQLSDAGYRKVNGKLLDKQGKPIQLRLWALAESVPEQSEAKLIAGWFKQLGLRINLSVVDEGVLESRLWNYDHGDYAPDFDMYIWDWDGYNDPGQTLATETTTQIESTNESCWSNAEYDALNIRQFSTLDPQQRQALIWRMQEIMYQQAPWAVLTYPDHFEAYNTDRWTGWTRALSGRGPAIYTASNVATYLNLRPTVGNIAQQGSHSSLGIVLIVAVVVAAGGVLVAIVIRRRRGEPEEEDV
jgi:peptide/nickel transport system substrate-binding protein